MDTITIVGLAGIVILLVMLVAIVVLVGKFFKAKADAKQYWEWMCNKKQEVDEWVDRAQVYDRDAQEAKQELKTAVAEYDIIEGAYSELNGKFAELVEDREILQTSLESSQAAFEERASELKASQRKLETTEYNLVEARDSERIAKDNWKAVLKENLEILEESKGLKETVTDLLEELMELEDSDVDKILILWDAYEGVPLEEKKAKILEILLAEYKEGSGTEYKED